MAEQTTNLNLVKPAYADSADVKDFNDNMDIIDGAVGRAQEDIDAINVWRPEGDGNENDVLRSKGDGTTEWVTYGLPTDEQTAAAVSDWLDDHPEATTTVVDGSIARAKLDADLKGKTDDVPEIRSALIQNNAMYGFPKLVFGNITVANDGTITYQTSGRYYGAVTPQNVYAYFLKGTTLYLTDYSNTKFFANRVDLLTGKSPDGSGWITTGKYIVEKEGYYIINIQDKNLTAKTEVDYFTRLFIVSNDMRVNTLETDVEEIQTSIGVNYVPQLILGNISINSSGVATYQTNRYYGAITRQNEYAHFEKGTVISLSSYQLTEQVAVKFFISYKKPDETLFPTGSGWITSGSYTVPKSGEYIINIQTVPTTNQDSASILSDLLVVQLNTISERVSTLEDEVGAKAEGFYSLRGIKVEQIINNYWPQGACAVDNDILFFAASNDAHTNHAEVSIYRLPNLMERTGYFDHNTGHAASADFAGDTNTLMITNATYEDGVTPYIFLIGGYRAKLEAKENIEYDGADVAKIDLTSLNGGMACFGETGDFAYVVTGDGVNYDSNITKTIYKLQIGYGANNMVSSFPSSSIGTYSYIDEDSPNGTAKIVGTWQVDFYGELQGLKCINGKLIIAVDTRKNGNIKTPYIISIEIDNAGARVVNTLWIPVVLKDGTRPAIEAEDIVFVNGNGYVTAGSNIYVFNENGI